MVDILLDMPPRVDNLHDIITICCIIRRVRLDLRPECLEGWLKRRYAHVATRQMYGTREEMRWRREKDRVTHVDFQRLEARVRTITCIPTNNRTQSFPYECEVLVGEWFDRNRQEGSTRRTYKSANVQKREREQQN